jgi:RTX calcium-binding nonapeptide repeat (4 copies)
MSKFARTVAVAAVAATALFAVSSGAGAATTVGQTVDPRGSNCTSEDTFLQAVSPGDQFAIPFDGVITSWSFLGGSVVPSPLKLKVGTVGTDSLTIHAESAFETPAPNQLNTFSARVPAPAQAVIGFSFPSPGDLVQCAAIGAPGYRDVVAIGDILPGAVGLSISEEPGQLDVSAVLEPDCDEDGLGDETQDQHISTCPTCKGKRATIVGGSGKDVFGGAAGRDVIVGLAGNDKLRGLGGNDVICGGSGKDNLKGGPGKDKLSGGSGKDKLKGGPGKDKLKGGPGKDKLKGGPGKDKQIQ